MKRSLSGLASFYSGHMDKAEGAFRSLASRLPLTEVYNNLGVVSARRGDRRARGYFEKACRKILTSRTTVSISPSLSRAKVTTRVLLGSCARYW